MVDSSKPTHVMGVVISWHWLSYCELKMPEAYGVQVSGTWHLIPQSSN